MIPTDIKAAVLQHPGETLRRDVETARARLAELGVSEASDFGLFFLEFQGPFPFGRGAKELLDIARPTASIHRSTRFVHEVWRVPAQFVCLVAPEGESCVLYDKNDESVYDVGLDELDKLRGDNPSPRWPTFVDYLRDYF